MRTPTFDSHADQYEADCMRGLSVSGESKEFFARGRLDYLSAFMARAGLSGPRRIVDFGCGVGDVTARLAQTFPQSTVVGLDPSARCLERAARDFASSRVSFAVIGEESGECLEPADLLHLNGVLHHVAIADRPALMESLWKRVRPGGVLALFENNPLNPGTRIVMARIPFDRDAKPITAFGTRSLLRAAGFNVCKTAYLFYFPRFLRALRPVERFLTAVPLGAQYVVIAVRRGSSASEPQGLSTSGAEDV
jgi:SAM-dependent methyltransferase